MQDIWKYAYLLIRVAVGCLGVFLLFGAFLYENKELKIQSMLEDAWIRLSDQESAAVSRHTAFMREIARISANLFDALFGEKLISMQAFSVSFFVSCLSGLAVIHVLHIPYKPPGWELWPIFALLASFASDICFIGVTRWALRWSSGMNQMFKIAGVVILDGLLAVLLVVGPTLLTARRFTLNWKSALPVGAHVSTAVHAGALVSVMNVVDALVASVFVLLTLAMFIHRLLWPILERPLYALQRLGMVGRRKLLATLGLAVIGFAMELDLERVQKIAEKLFG